MSASTVAAVIGALADEPWMPRISHWEIATTDDVWGAHAELDCQASGPAFRELHALAEKLGSAVTKVSDHLSAVDFEHDEVPVRVWWLRPALRWVVPATCATCPTKLSGEPGAKFVRLGEGDREAPVICVPCRDRMQSEFVAAARRLASPSAARIAQEERTALPVAWAALESRQSSQGIAEAIVGALFSAGLLQSPESAVEVQAVREQLAARTFYLADVEGVDDGLSLHATVDVAKAWVEEIGGPGGDWFERDGVWEQWHTDLDTDRPTGRGAGRVLPLVVEGDGIVAEALRVRRELVGQASRLASLMKVRADEREVIRQLQREQGEVMKALGCEQQDEWDDVVHRARQLAGGSAVSS